MQQANVAFQPIVYHSLSKNLFFTDFDFSQLNGIVAIDDNIMVELLQHSNNSIRKMENIISNNVAKENESVERILLLFSENHSNFFDQFHLLIKTCKEKFPKASISSIISKLENYHKISEANLSIHIIFKSNFVYAMELEDIIDTKFLRIQIYYNFARCHHWILTRLEKRLGDSLTYLEQTDKFAIEENGKILTFVRNYSDKTFSVYDVHNKCFLKITNEHLLGLYDTSLLFNIVAYLNDIEVLVKYDIKIENDEIVLLNL